MPKWVRACLSNLDGPKVVPDGGLGESKWD